MRKLALLLLSGFTLLCRPAMAATELQFWHAMQGTHATALQKLVDRFNASQQNWQVVPSFHGSYEQTMEAGLTASRQGKAPHLLQVHEVGTADMMSQRGTYKPLYQLANETNVPVDKKAYFPPAAAFYSESPGKLLALPFNVSTPVLFYNRDAFAKADLDPNKPPVSWYDMQPMLIALQTAGSECAYTTSWQSWVHLENVSAWHNYPFAGANNGFGQGKADLLFNSHLMIRHVSLLAAWNKSSLFIYSGRRNEGEARFASGECAMFTGSSADIGEVTSKAGFNVGIAPLPHYDDFKGSPYNTLAGGAALWVMSGKSAGEYSGVARFLQFLASSEAAVEWHESTGYVPMTREAHAMLQKAGYYQQRPQMDIAVGQLRGVNSGTFAHGLRLRHHERLRVILDEELEEVWKGNKPPKQALDDAVSRGNTMMGTAPIAVPVAMPRGPAMMRKPAAAIPARKGG